MYIILRGRHCIWDTLTPHSTLYTWHPTLYILHFTLYTSHCTLHTLYFTLHTLHLTLYTPHFTLHTSHFKLDTPHSTQDMPDISPHCRLGESQDWKCLIYQIFICIYHIRALYTRACSLLLFWINNSSNNLLAWKQACLGNSYPDQV